MNRWSPNSSSRNTSKVQRSPSTSRATATGQYCSYVRLVTGHMVHEVVDLYQVIDKLYRRCRSDLRRSSRVTTVNDPPLAELSGIEQLRAALRRRRRTHRAPDGHGGGVARGGASGVRAGAGRAALQPHRHRARRHRRHHARLGHGLRRPLHAPGRRRGSRPGSPRALHAGHDRRHRAGRRHRRDRARRRAHRHGARRGWSTPTAPSWPTAPPPASSCADGPTAIVPP